MASTPSFGDDNTVPAVFVFSAPPLQPPPTRQGTLENPEHPVETMNIQMSALPHQPPLRRRPIRVQRHRQNIENADISSRDTVNLSSLEQQHELMNEPISDISSGNSYDLSYLQHSGDMISDVGSWDSVDLSFLQNFGARKNEQITDTCSRNSIDLSLQQLSRALRNDNTAGPSRDRNFYLPLYKAALKGDWEAANAFLEDEPDAVTARITVFDETALQVAASAGHARFVVRMMEKMSDEALEMQDDTGNTALFFAVLADCTEAARAMVTRNPRLTQIRNRKNLVPLHHAPRYAGKEMTNYLCSVTRNEDPSPFEGETGSRLINDIIGSGFYDIALDLLQHYPQLATGRDGNGITALDMLAQRPSAFKSGSWLGFLQRCIYSSISLKQVETPQHPTVGDIENPSEGCGDLMPVLFHISQGIQFLNAVFWNFAKRLVPIIKQVHDTKLKHKQALELLKFICKQLSAMDNSQIIEYFLKANILSLASWNGIVELIIECTQYFPDLVWMKTNKHSIFHMAVLHRQEKIFILIHGMSANRKLLISDIINGNNILHMAARLAPSTQLNSVSGAALQMQRELQWFKEVEKIVDPSSKELINLEGKTPRALFSEEHKDLLEKGEKWMKDTAASCMVVATLIATVVFTAAFTVPGGNNGEKGIPIFLQANSFMVFIISDAIGLFSSAASVLMFLSILTARYSEEDFLESLPEKLILGLATLFISIATMVIAFGATLVIVLSTRMQWVVVPVTLFACFPVALFALLHFPLFVEIVHSTYMSGIFHQRGEHIIY